MTRFLLALGLLLSATVASSAQESAPAGPDRAKPIRITDRSIVARGGTLPATPPGVFQSSRTWVAYRGDDVLTDAAFFALVDRPGLARRSARRADLGPRLRSIGAALGGIGAVTLVGAVLLNRRPDGRLASPDPVPLVTGGLILGAGAAAYTVGNGYRYNAAPARVAVEAADRFNAEL